MSTRVHSLIILPGSNLIYFCKDGLSPLSIMLIEKIFNFGGRMRAMDCGVESEYAALMIAETDMWHLY